MYTSNMKMTDNNSVANSTTKKNENTHTHTHTNTSLINNNKYYHNIDEANQILSYLHLNNDIQNQLLTYIKHINLQNQTIFKQIIQLFTNIYNAFDILFINSAKCTVVVPNTSIYLIYDSKLEEYYKLINNYTNNYDINNLTLFINNLFNANKELYYKNSDIYVKSIQNTNMKTSEENIQIICQFIEIVNSFDITDKLSNTFQNIYMEFIKIYQSAHKCIMEASNNIEHCISENIKTIISNELQKARLLIPDIKNNIDIYTELIPGIKPFIASYVENCNAMMNTYKS
jgi:hypothetical protein